MSTTISRYLLPIGDNVALFLPEQATILTVHPYGAGAHLFVHEQPEAILEHRRFRWFGTGQAIDTADLRYIGTIQLYDAGLVWHLFEAA